MNSKLMMPTSLHNVGPILAGSIMADSNVSFEQ
jgi:hypothetical protein